MHNLDALKLGADLLSGGEVAFDHHDGRLLLQQVSCEGLSDDAAAHDADAARLAFLAEESLRREHALGASDQVHAIPFDQNVRAAGNEQLPVTHDRAHQGMRG